MKILFQDLAETLGLGKLNSRLQDPRLQHAYVGIFPRDTPKNLRFAINFFTSIGLGGVTDELREYLKNMPKMALMQKEQREEESDETSSDSSSDSDSDSSDLSDSSSDDSSDISSDTSSDISSDSDSDASREERRTKRRRQRSRSRSPISPDTTKKQ